MHNELYKIAYAQQIPDIPLKFKPFKISLSSALNTHLLPDGRDWWVDGAVGKWSLDSSSKVEGPSEVEGPEGPSEVEDPCEMEGLSEMEGFSEVEGPGPN